MCRNFGNAVNFSHKTFTRRFVHVKSSTAETKLIRSPTEACSPKPHPSRLFACKSYCSLEAKTKRQTTVTKTQHLFRAKLFCVALDAAAAVLARTIEITRAPPGGKPTLYPVTACIFLPPPRAGGLWQGSV